MATRLFLCFSSYVDYCVQKAELTASSTLFTCQERQEQDYVTRLTKQGVGLSKTPPDGFEIQRLSKNAATDQKLMDNARCRHSTLSRLHSTQDGLFGTLFSFVHASLCPATGALDAWLLQSSTLHAQFKSLRTVKTTRVPLNLRVLKVAGVTFFESDKVRNHVLCRYFHCEQNCSIFCEITCMEVAHQTESSNTTSCACTTSQAVNWTKRPLLNIRFQLFL